MVRRNPLRALMVATGVLIIAAAVGLVVVDGDSGSKTVRAAGSPTSSSSSSTTVADDTTTTTVVASTTVAPATTPATRTASTQRTATTTPAGAVRAPAPGAYRYAEDGSGPGGATHNEYTMTITAAPDEGGATRRNVAINGNGEDEQAWGSDAVRSLRKPGTYPCTWNPPRTLYLGTLTAGASWSIDSTCAKTTAPYPQTTRERTQYSVSRRDADGTWVIHFKQLVTLTEANYPDQQHVTGDGQGDIWLDAARGLVVRRHETRSSEDQPNVRTYDTRLLG